MKNVRICITLVLDILPVTGLSLKQNLVRYLGFTLTDNFTKLNSAIWGQPNKLWLFENRLVRSLTFIFPLFLLEFF